MHSGDLDLLYMRGLEGMPGRLKYADMLLQSEEGGHVDLDFVRSEKVGQPGECGDALRAKCFSVRGYPMCRPS